MVPCVPNSGFNPGNGPIRVLQSLNMIRALGDVDDVSHLKPLAKIQDNGFAHEGVEEPVQTLRQHRLFQ